MGKDCICSGYDNIDMNCFGARCFNGYWDQDCLVTISDGTDEEGPSIGLPGDGVGEKAKECNNCPTVFEQRSQCDVDRYNDCICSGYDNLREDCFGARCFDGYWDADCKVTTMNEDSSTSEDSSQNKELSPNDKVTSPSDDSASTMNSLWSSTLLISMAVFFIQF